MAASGEFIEKQMRLYPELSADYEKIGRLSEKKLYHELTGELEQFVKKPDAMKSSGANLIDLYEDFIKPIQAKFNKLKLVQIVYEISLQYKDVKDTVEFLEKFLKCLESNDKFKEAFLLCTMKIATLQLSLDVPAILDTVKKTLNDNKEVVEGLVGAEPVVHSAYYYAACQYHLKVGPPDLFYKNAIMFLAYSSYEDLKPNERFELATNISIAALTGEGVFNFGEVLATPILKALEGTDKEWLSKLLHAFNKGDIDVFNDIVGTFRSEYETQPALVSKQEFVKEKVSLMCLIELIFRCPSHERNIPFSTIARETRLPIDQVEWLVMRALSVGLIKGSIDQVGQIVHVSWVQPRVLDKAQMSELKDRLGDWGKKVHETLLLVEDETPELFQ